MREASTVEEDDDRDDLGGAQGLFKLYDAPLRLVFRSWLIHPIEEPGVSIDMVEREHPIYRNCIGGNLPVKELCKLSVEGAIRTSK